MEGVIGFIRTSYRLEPHAALIESPTGIDGGLPEECRAS